MKKIIFILSIAFVVSLSNVNAQKGYTSFQYGISFGTGDVGDYVSAPSFRGFLFEYKYAFNEKLYAGFDLGWNMFYEKKDKATYTKGTESVTGVQFRYNRDVPFLISADYFFRPGQKVNPYVNFGIGGLYAKRTTEMGVFYIQEESWQFAIKPEAGLLFEVNRSGAIKFSVKYYNGFKSGDLEGQSYVSLGIGYVILF